MILDGIERAERNVLPVLNNLLENREMQLDDGRFLVSPRRYQRLLEKFTPEEIEQQKLVPVHPNFRVIALGLPIPTYTGNLLDPPLRSRFQARQIMHELPTGQLTSELDKNLRLLTTSEVRQHGVRPSSEQFEDIIKLESGQAFSSMKELVSTIYPYSLLHKGTTKDTVEDFISNTAYAVEENPLGLDFKNTEDFVWTESTKNLMTKMMLSHGLGKDICLFGNKGSGKTSIVQQFAKLNKIEIEPVFLYKDISWRELLQQRYTDSNGNTKWSSAPLVKAAVEGKICVLDGVDQLHHGVLSALQSLVQDRILDLPDGKRLVRAENCIDSDRLLPIHPDFRIVAIADSTPGQSWLNTDTSALFHFHKVPTYTKEEFKTITGCPDQLTQLLEKVDKSEELKRSLSLRSVLRMSKNLQHQKPEFTQKHLSYEVGRACMSKFLPTTQKQDLENSMADCGLELNVSPDEFTLPEISKEFSKFGAEVKIPDIVFFKNDQQAKIIDNLLYDLKSGQNILLVGNQGVGKNKIIDHLLQTHQRACEYVQVHRDTTVGSLVTESKVEKGELKIGDSALIRSLKEGTVLMLDEVDKAPTHVTAILKALVDKQDFTLPDGRKLDFRRESEDPTSIKVHPNFQMIVLANRPGFPFLGNNFFAVMGDRFSCHIVDNPDIDATLQLIKPYAENVEESILKKLISAFSKLRNLNEEQILQYPYSTREIVSIAKHFNEFPEDGIVAALNNVFDFDMEDNLVLDRVAEVLSQSGIPIVGGREQIKVELAESKKLSELKVYKVDIENKNPQLYTLDLLERKPVIDQNFKCTTAIRTYALGQTET